MKKFLIGLAATAVSFVAPLSAFAQTAPAGGSAAFTTSVTAVTADIATYGAALIGVAAVGVGFMVGMKYVKKIRGAA